MFIHWIPNPQTNVAYIRSTSINNNTLIKIWSQHNYRETESDRLWPLTSWLLIVCVYLSVCVSGVLSIRTHTVFSAFRTSSSLCEPPLPCPASQSCKTDCSKAFWEHRPTPAAERSAYEQREGDLSGNDKSTFNKLKGELVHVCFFTLSSVTPLRLSFDNTASTT